MTAFAPIPHPWRILSFCSSLACIATTAACVPHAGGLGASSATASHRERERGPVYRLAFVVSSDERGKAPLASDSYTILLEESRSGEIAVGSNVLLTPATSRADVGLRIRCRYVASGSDLLFDVSANESSVPDEGSGIRKFATDGSALVTPGKPTLVASLDDPWSRKHVEITVTATKVD